MRNFAILAGVLFSMPALSATATRVLTGWTAGSGVLSTDHCEVTVALNPVSPPANVVEIKIEGAEAPVLTWSPDEYQMDSPAVSSGIRLIAGQVISDGTKEWWRGYNYDHTGAFVSGNWTFYLEKHPSGCGFYDGTTRILILY